uniref:Uncharacterized protein n=1 Tax=Arundo donax TaxID=35708 RepID=A0A0A9HEN2_ARUDO
MWNGQMLKLNALMSKIYRIGLELQSPHLLSFLNECRYRAGRTYSLLPSCLT